MSSEELSIHGMFGFEGAVRNSLKYHPDKDHILYPIGQSVYIQNIRQFGRSPIVLQGHNGPVSCIAISKSGRYIASGQSTHMGFKASVIIWDYLTKTILHKLLIHKVKVECLAFSRDEKFLVSVGGQDDNNIIVWDVESGKSICGKVSPFTGNCVTFFNTTNKYIVVGGKYKVFVWAIDYVNRNLQAHPINMGTFQRIVSCFVMDRKDEFMYCGTSSGDVLCVQMKTPRNFKFSGPKKRIGKGVKCIGFTVKGNILVGGGNGFLYVLKRTNLMLLKKIKLSGEVKSVTGLPTGDYYAGTSTSDIYHLNKQFDKDLIHTCHSTRINCVTFPDQTSEIFATCGHDIRLWSSKSMKELLRISVAEKLAIECNCIAFSHRGHLIASGWSDGKIRAFGPQSGKLLFTINEAHKVIENKSKRKGVTAVNFTYDDARILSGGQDGQFRIWKLGNQKQTLEMSLKQHKATINQIVITRDNDEAISAGDDGSCIIWDLEKHIRSNILYQTTYFTGVCLLNDESQVLTCGSNKLVTFWDKLTVDAIRELEAGDSEINCVDISPTGDSFCCGGNDNVLKIWDYDEGVEIRHGATHAGNILSLMYSPDDKFIVSTDDQGAIMIWNNILMEKGEEVGEME